MVMSCFLPLFGIHTVSVGGSESYSTVEGGRWFGLMMREDELLKRLHEAATLAEANGFSESAAAYREMLQSELERVGRLSCVTMDPSSLVQTIAERNTLVAAE